MSSQIGVINGSLLEKDILNPYAYRSYRSIIRKVNNITGHITIINEMYKKIIESLPTIEPDDENRLICSLQDCCENIYSCMDYLSQVLRQVYKDIYRGVELPDGFNDILKDVDKYEENPDEKKRPMYKNKILRSYILKSRYWYQLVHDIRTEETHYGMGDLEIENDKVMYHNLKRSNRNGGKGKEKGEKEEKEIRFHISEINGIYAEFCNYINELDKLILTI